MWWSKLRALLSAMWRRDDGAPQPSCTQHRGRRRRQDRDHYWPRTDNDVLRARRGRQMRTMSEMWGDLVMLEPDGR